MRNTKQGNETMTSNQRTKLNRLNASISLQERILANLESMELVTDNGRTIELTKGIIYTLKTSRTAFINQVS